ncbi:MAG: L,D-transpeptidase family protein [Bacteroidales bacterium]|nr:L,D-transpeptidase family protein [Bacteroidales bacterium]
MKVTLLHCLLLLALPPLMALAACGGRSTSAIEGVEIHLQDIIEEAITMVEEEIPPVPRDTEGMLRWMRESKDSAEFAQGILPRMAQEQPQYCYTVLTSPHPRFIVVDKRRMRVLLFSRTGLQLNQYKMACGRKYGTKQEKGDCRTPEGLLSVKGVYDSTDWLYTDDEGYTSPIKGQFGPRFIRLQTIRGRWLPVGIHGTCAPWSLGNRSSHGCIRIHNDSILKLAELVDSGMLVIVNPGRRDMIENVIAGHDIPAIVTDDSPVITLKDSEIEDARPVDTAAMSPDSITAPLDSLPAPPSPDSSCLPDSLI